MKVFGKIGSRLRGSGNGREAKKRPGFLEPGDIDAALTALEVEGFAMRGRYSAGAAQDEWCERRLLARIHRYTLNRLRAEIEPVTPADFMRFLFRWQHVDPSSRLTGLDGLREIVASLDGRVTVLAAGGEARHADSHWRVWLLQPHTE